jgi:hypothetical protein
MPPLCAHFHPSARQGCRLLSRIHHGILPSGSKHVHDTFAVWTLSRNARVDQEGVCSIDWDQGGRIELCGWASLLGTMRTANGLGGHGKGSLCGRCRSRGRDTHYRTLIVASVQKVVVLNGFSYIYAYCKSKYITLKYRYINQEWFGAAFASRKESDSSSKGLLSVHELAKRKSPTVANILQ